MATRPRNQLTATEVFKAQAKDDDYRLADGDRLFILVAKTGGKSGQFRYKVKRTDRTYKADTITVGKIDDRTMRTTGESLTKLREAADELRAIHDDGRDPKLVQRIDRATRIASDANTFKLTAAAWVKWISRRKQWSQRHQQKVEQLLTRHLSDLDDLPIMEIVAPVTSPLLQRIEESAPHMAEKVDRVLNGILDYTVEQGMLVRNPLPRRSRAVIERKHFPAITKLPGIGEILRAARASDPCKGIQRAHELLAFTVQRPREAAGARWREFDLDAGNWSIPRERMKQRKAIARGPHVVPLPPALLAQLREWRKADPADATHVCPAPRDAQKAVTIEAIEKHYRDVLKLGGKHSPHSWRSAFSTVCREAGKDGDVVEAQLDHVVGSKVASAYDRAKRLDLRRELMRWYEATLLAARDGAPVLPIRKASAK